VPATAYGAKSAPGPGDLLKAPPQTRPRAQRRPDRKLGQTAQRRIRSAPPTDPELYDHFELIDGEMHVENVPIAAIAEAVGTPVYAYSAARLTARMRALFRDGVAPLGRVHLAFAIKANPNLAVLRLLANEGFGADVVSGGEMSRALAAGMAAKDIVFSGVGKTRAELIQGLEAGIGQFNLELEEEGVVLAQLAAARGLRARAALRVNPTSMPARMRRSRPARPRTSSACRSTRHRRSSTGSPGWTGLDLRGIAVHIGSQLLSLDPLEAAFERVGRLVANLRAPGTPSPMSISAAGSACLRPNEVPAQPGRIRRDGRARDKGLGRRA
jgi:diaminopimelate decarboxylase